MNKKKMKIISIIVLVGIIIGMFSNTSAEKISSTSSKNLYKNFIEIAIQIYGPDNTVSFTITVTESQKKELDTFINSFKEDLEKTENNADTATNFINAIETFDEMGFIPNSFNYEQLQDQIIENVQINNQVTYNANSQKLDNYFCLIAGYADEIIMESYIPFQVVFGWWDNQEGYHPADGWIFTSGINGYWIYDGQFYGSLDVLPIGGPFCNLYIGAKGFIGMKINYFLIGYAAMVGIETV
jgi:hypothetical protein